jgi:hypothetical protein
VGGRKGVRALTHERLIVDTIFIESWIEATGSGERASFENLSQREARLREVSRMARKYKTS